MANRKVFGITLKELKFSTKMETCFKLTHSAVSSSDQTVHRPLSDFQCYNLTEDPGNKRKDATRDRDLLLDLCPPR